MPAPFTSPLRVLLIMPALLFATSVSAGREPVERGGYFEDRARGWFWYERLPEAPKQGDRTSPQPAAVTPGQDPQAVLKAYQKRLEDAKALAVMDPTPANVKRYMALQQEAMNRAGVFADTWRRVVWSTPELDATLRAPVNRIGLEVRKNENREARDGVIADLARTDGMFWFFRQDCPYCHAQAPILRRFAERYGIDVVPISLDGGLVPEFPNARRDVGWAEALGVTHTPALFMVNPRTREIVPVGFGVLTEEDLKDRIYVVALKRVGEF
jgi:conjugal transfer pilus assembly protein TraF